MRRSKTQLCHRRLVQLNRCFRRCITVGLIASGSIAIAPRQSPGAAITWANTGATSTASLNSSGSYTGSPTINSSAVPTFPAGEATNPQLTAPLTIAALNFSSTGSYGYDFLDSSTYSLTLSAYGTGGSGSSASTAAAIYSTATGLNTFDVPIIFASSSATAGNNMAYVHQAGAGGSLVFNQPLSNSTNTTVTYFRINGGSTITLNAADAFTGGVTLDRSTASGASTTAGTLAVGNDSAFGPSTTPVTFSSSITLTAVGGAHAIANPIVFGGDGIVGGSNNVTLSGTFTSSGSQSRTLTVNNTGATTLSGPVYLASSDAAGGLTVTGTGSPLISGVITNNSSTNLVASALSKGGTGILTLTATSTYTGSTNISAGTLSVGNAQHVSASIATSPTVNLNTSTASPASTTLVLFNALALSPNATLNITTTNQTLTQTIDLDFNNATQSISSFVIDGSSIAPGTYPVGTTFAGGAAVLAADNGYSSGSLTVTPEPASVSLMLGGLSVGLLRRRRRESFSTK